MKAKKIALSLAIMAFAFSPLANATTYNLGTLSAIPSNTSISSSSSDAAFIFESPLLPSTLSGTSAYSFSSEVSVVLGGTPAGDALSGYALSYVEVFKGATLIDKVLATQTPGGSSTVGFPGGTATTTTFNYSAVIGDIKLAPSSTYTVEVFGTSYSGPFIGNIAINAAAAAVPEAEEWAMLLLGLPLIAWASGRKSAVKSSVVAA